MAFVCCLTQIQMELTATSEVHQFITQRTICSKTAKHSFSKIAFVITRLVEHVTEWSTGVVDEADFTFIISLSQNDLRISQLLELYILVLMGVLLRWFF